MTTVETTVDVHVPLRQAYDQWTQFEEFPRFMSQVEQVEQLDDSTLRWKVRAVGAEREFLADITTQEPDSCIAWRAQGDTKHAGVVQFEAVDPTTTRVRLEMEVEPDDWVEKVADAVGAYSLVVKRDLDNFKEFIEARGTATGGWRGTISSGIPS